MIGARPARRHGIREICPHYLVNWPDCSPGRVIRTMTYRPEIDGLRALAVLPVILFHARFETFAGGFVGVDVFFVISGYLITSLILAEKEAGAFSLVSFYERRARRILPALFLVMAACIPFAWLWLLPNDMKAFSLSLAAVSVFAANILLWRESGYFDTAAELKPLIHTWSLSVEEQYYVLFPLFIMLTWRFGRRRIAGILCFIALASLSLAEWGAYHQPDAAFFLLPTRAWELAIGAIAAFCAARFRPMDASATIKQALSGSGLLLILYAVFVFDRSTPFPGLYALVPTAGTALILLFATPATAVGAMLASRPFVGIGLVSYSAYLWHQPLLAFARHRAAGELGDVLPGVLSVASLILAYFSWRYVEQPCRRRERIGRQTILVTAALASVTFIAFGLAGHHEEGFRDYYVANRLSADEAQLYKLVQKHVGRDMSRHMFDDGECRFWMNEVNRDFERRFFNCSVKYGKGWIVVGDSHAMNVYNIVAKANFSRFVTGVSRGGCRPYDGNSRCHYAAFDGFVKRNRNDIHTVVFHQSGSHLLLDRDGSADSQRAFDADAEFVFHSGNVETISNYLNRLGESVNTIWLGPFVEARVDFNALHKPGSDFVISDKSLSQFGRLEGVLKQMTAVSQRNYRYVSLHDILKIDKTFLKVGTCITYRDVDHFSSCGEDLLATRVAEAFNDRVFDEGRR